VVARLLCPILSGLNAFVQIIKVIVELGAKHSQ